MVKRLFYVACLALSLAVTSCTLNEEQADTLPAQNYLLKSLKAGGVIAFVNYEYDSRNRLTECSIGSDEVYTMTYEGNNTVPSRIIIKTYNYYEPNYSEDREVRYLSEESVCTVTKTSSEGYITAFSVEDKEWIPVYNVVNGENVAAIELRYHDFYTKNLEYDSEGHCTYTHDSDGEWSRFNWKNGVVTDIRFEDGSYTEFEYCDENNIANQWDPMAPMFGPIQITYWFGNAPKKLLKGYYDHSSDDPDENERVEISYRMLSNGLIHAAHYNGLDNGQMTVTYNYKSVR